jgi:hypothetical protein
MGASSTEQNVLLLLEALETALVAEGFQPAGSGSVAAQDFYAASG